ncbi:ferric reductase [Spathaspora passalidarum NRRL Y-27907]|uniref:ferric-chelate reductase (NADPH) n=1 Tax=Spathaspora passalidarum (strain NRRL Y-27907 / 11-Y1) TaxID=619300 RepID=G3AH37_SPAPN|nr:ferric reductase [Spathaspora passalidarum NRRL Y-27907]EGW35467.1 ferric reductase [Spathaspora passalidarum NRRL Y-27907]
MNIFSLLYFGFILLAGVQAHGKEHFTWYKKSLAIYACNYEISYLKGISFCPAKGNKRERKKCRCANENWRASLAGCLAYKERNTTSTIEFYKSFCQNNYNVDLDKDWFDKSYTHFLNNAKNKYEIKPSREPVNFPVKFSPKEMDLYGKVAINFLGNYDDSIWYGISMFGFWFLVLTIGAISHWTKVLFPETTKKLVGSISNSYRKYISIPALYGKRRAQEIRCWKVFDSLIPTRFESIVIGLFYLFTVIIHAVNLKAVENDPIFDTKYMAEIRYVADRTGIVGTAMTPLVFLFAGRNNFLQWITGINFSTFLCYHRHIARVMVMLVVIHSVNYTILLVYRETFPFKVKNPWLYWGILATVAGGLALFQSILYLRRSHYELFLFLHLALAVLFVAGTWIHIVDFGYCVLLYPCIAVWCFDRIIRLIRLFSFGFPQANVMLVGDETIKLEIPKPKYWKPVPGGHVFVHFLKPSYFWQSHPFTFVKSSEKEGIIVIYLKLKGGITQNLYKLLKKSPGKMATMRVGIEGPYGESTPAKYSDKAVFIAGGNGIPGIYSEVVDISLRSPSERKSQLKLIWVIRDYNSIIWFYDELLWLKNTDIKTTLFVTRPNNRVTNFGSFNKSESSQEGSIKSGYNEINPQPYKGQNYIEEFKAELSHINFEERRPNFEQLIHDEIEESPGSVAFVACGHPAMVDEVRYQSCRNIDNPYNKRVDFYEQLQVWA